LENIPILTRTIDVSTRMKELESTIATRTLTLEAGHNINDLMAQKAKLKQSIKSTVQQDTNEIAIRQVLIHTCCEYPLLYSRIFTLYGLVDHLTTGCVCLGHSATFHSYYLLSLSM